MALMTNNKHEGLIMENVKVLTIKLQKGKQRCKTLKTYFLCWKMLLRVYDVSASYFPMFIVISCFGLAEFSASHLFRHNPPPTELLFQRPHNSRITHRERILTRDEAAKTKTKTKTNAPTTLGSLTGKRFSAMRRVGGA